MGSNSGTQTSTLRELEGKNKKLLLAFGGHPRSGKDYAAGCISEHFKGVQIFSIGELICRELGMDRVTADLRRVQAYSKTMYDKDSLCWVRKIVNAVNKSNCEIAIMTNCRRLAEAEYFVEHGWHMVRFVRLNNNGSEYIVGDRDMNHELETEMDFYPWPKRIIATSGNTYWLRAQAISLVHYLRKEECCCE